MKENSRSVALILDTEFGERAIPICRRMPVWMVESGRNQPVVEVIWQATASANLTTFSLNEGETAAMACERIVGSLDDHYNAAAQTPGYDELDVIGVSLDEVALQPFDILGFTQFVPAEAGFIARKRTAGRAAA